MDLTDVCDDTDRPVLAVLVPDDGVQAKDLAGDGADAVVDVAVRRALLGGSMVSERTGAKRVGGSSTYPEGRDAAAIHVSQNCIEKGHCVRRVSDGR